MTQIYLISPPQIELKDFSIKLEKALKTLLVPAFQLRLKNYSPSEVKKISQEIKKICENNNCLFLLNDFYEIALEVGASGVHVGIDDKKISQIRQNSPKNFIIGASCYDSKHLAMEAGEQGADYISFGAFFETKTKISPGKPSLEILNWASEILNLPIVAIGGINDKNCGELIKNGADFLAIISYVWQHPQGVEVALKNIDKQNHDFS
jgi:thiamine-phosphate pyrophosphorylase